MSFEKVGCPSSLQCGRGLPSGSVDGIVSIQNSEKEFLLEQSGGGGVVLLGGSRSRC